MSLQIFVGTSGFSYKEWKGPFYPEDLPQKKMLEYYSSQLRSVEINNTFYRMPKVETLETWRDAVPESFRFVLKVSRRITHQKALKDKEDSVRYLLETSQALGEKRGPFLLQLPPYLRKDLDLLEAFLDIWPSDAPVAVEFRHRGWFDTDTYELLERNGVALCCADGSGELPAVLQPTADFGYLRLRREDYEANHLASWAERIRTTGWSSVFVFFKHEDAGAGPRMAAQFEQLLEV